MNETIRQILAMKNMGWVQFNEDFSVEEVDEVTARLLRMPFRRSVGSGLMSIFPEFIGSDDYILDVLNRRENEFRLEYVNRIDASGETFYVHLLILPDEQTGRGMVIVEDATRAAKTIQKLNQQHYELLLYRNSDTFRKKLLSESILGSSPAISGVKEMIRKLGRAPVATVLLLGESGTGKNLTARVIHYSSMSADAPFVDINCAALPEHLIEAELFGYEKGAFTSATRSRAGLIEEAQGGSVFLDEIGELTPNLQAKLLSVLESKTLRRLGSNKSIKVDVRVIAATNRDLQQEVRDKRFREDLFYRLNVVSITMPPLRSMGEDVLVITGHLIKVFNVEFNKKVLGLSKSAHQKGNVAPR